VIDNRPRERNPPAGPALVCHHRYYCNGPAPKRKRAWPCVFGKTSEGLGGLFEGGKKCRPLEYSGKVDRSQNNRGEEGGKLQKETGLKAANREINRRSFKDEKRGES